MKGTKLLNRKYLKDIRSYLRNNSTKAEAALWNILKSRQLEERKFRRQYSVGNYIVDFCCPSEKIVVELDGDTHGSYTKIESDKIRDKFLEGNGFTVIRFENRFVFQEPVFVKSEIREIIIKKEQNARKNNHPGTEGKLLI